MKILKIIFKVLFAVAILCSLVSCAANTRTACPAYGKPVPNYEVLPY